MDTHVRWAFRRQDAVGSRPPVRRGALLQLGLFAVVAFVIVGAVALVPRWLPTQASEQAHRIDFVFWFVTVICAAIFAIVAAVLTYSLIHFRAPPDDDSDGPPIHGHTGLEIAWTAVPFVLVTSMAIISAIVLARDDRTGKDPLHVDVTAQQFAWSFKYPDAHGLTSDVLRLPEGKTVAFTIRALDVIHSFWVPEFGQKQDAVPGIVTRLTVTPNRVGTYPVICTELCGLGHSVMRSTVIVMKPDAFAAWLKSAGKSVAGPGAGKAIFVNNGCSACHTLAAAGATGKIGPDLDKLPAYAAQAHQPLEKFVHDSIVTPNSYIQPGFAKGIMPQNFGSTIPADQLASLVQYLIASSKGAK